MKKKQRKRVLIVMGIVVIVLLLILTEILHVGFFMIAIFACPIGFLIGIVGTIKLFAKKRKMRQEIGKYR